MLGYIFFGFVDGPFGGELVIIQLGLAVDEKKRNAFGFKRYLGTGIEPLYFIRVKSVFGQLFLQFRKVAGVICIFLGLCN